MPLSNGKYVSPTWKNGQAPAIDAGELQAMSDTLEQSSAYNAMVDELVKEIIGSRTMVFTSTQSWTAPAIAGPATVMLCGGGAAGGGSGGSALAYYPSSNSSTGQVGGAGGDGGKGYSTTKTITLIPGETYLVTVGSGGSPAGAGGTHLTVPKTESKLNTAYTAGSGTDGTDGGSSSFGSLASVSGGKGGKGGKGATAKWTSGGDAASSEGSKGANGSGGTGLTYGGTTYGGNGRGGFQPSSTSFDGNAGTAGSKGVVVLIY